jgi:HlyD family secretion protein
MRQRTWLALAGVTVIVAGTAVWRLRPRPEIHATDAPVTSGPIVRRIVASGTMQAVETVDVGAQVSGTLASIDVDFNSRVRKGQQLAKIDPAIYSAQTAQAKAALTQAEADLAGYQVALEDASTKLARAEPLASAQLIAPSDLDAAQIALSTANANVKLGESAVAQARAAVNQAAVNLDRTIIRSPIDGIVVSRAVDVGQTLVASLQSPVLFSVATDLTHMQVDVEIDEADIAGVYSGEPVTFEVEAYADDVFQGRISQIRVQPTPEPSVTSSTSGAAATPGGGSSATTASATVSYAVIAEVDNPDERLRPGMTATVTLNGASRQNAVRLPNAALSFRPADAMLALTGQADIALTRETSDRAPLGRPAWVWRYDGRQFTPIAVTCGLPDDSWTELLDGAIRPGDSLVTNAVVR